MSLINSNLKKAIEEVKYQNRLKQSDIADILDYKTPYLSDIINGRKPMSEQFSDRFCDKFGVNKGWLLTGEGEMLKPTPNTYKNIAFGNKGDNNNIVQGDAIVYGADNETQQLKRKLTELEDRYNALIVSKDDLLKEKDERIKELNNMIRILSQNK